MRILVTGGAGFDGSSPEPLLKRDWPKAEVVALDNPRCRGSEIFLGRLRQAGDSFVQGDARTAYDLDDTGDTNPADAVNDLVVRVGKVDQGIFVPWAARPLFGGSLSRGGEVRQVRDFLHVEDLHEVIELQSDRPETGNDAPHNIERGPALSLFLAEPMPECRARAGRDLEMASDPVDRPYDVPYYATDNGTVTRRSGWAPKRRTAEVLDDIFMGLRDQQDVLRPVLSA
jgi:nucleoside-diphosphate-sugar epimerase